MYKDENLTLYRSKVTSLLIEKKRYRKINNVWLLGQQDFHKNVPNSNWNVILEALDKKKGQSMEAEGLQKILHC